MIINAQVQAVAGAYQSQGLRKSPAKETQVEAASKAGEVVLSREAQSFSGMLRELHTMEGVREDKVNYYREAIAAGTYDVAGSNIAASMMGLRF